MNKTCFALTRIVLSYIFVLIMVVALAVLSLLFQPDSFLPADTAAGEDMGAFVMLEFFLFLGIFQTAFMFGIIAIIVGEIKAQRRWTIHAATGTLLMMISTFGVLALLFLQTDEGDGMTITATIVLAAACFAGLLGSIAGSLYWLMAGRFAGRLIGPQRACVRKIFAANKEKTPANV